MSDLLTIRETCGCGASFEFRGAAIYAGVAATEWRDRHKHTESVRICGNQAPFSGMLCELKAGHTGPHEDGEAQWGECPEEAR